MATPDDTAELDALVSQRDELLEVVEDAIALLTNEDETDLAPKWASRARSAIEKVKS